MLDRSVSELKAPINEPAGGDLSEATPAVLKVHRPALFAADLHLDGSEPARERLQQLLRVAHSEGADLYLLGDVFHYWFGRKHLALPMFRREIQLFRAMSSLGVSITIVPGNRDFLLDEAFTRETGVKVSGDSMLIELGGERVHLSHGDLFGLADVRYQRMRRVLHSAPIRRLAASLPAVVVNALARRLRRHSETVVLEKSPETLAPDRESIAALFSGTSIDVVVCGHFHEARDEAFPPSEGGGRFRILEPFEEHGYVLSASSAGWRERRLGGEADPYPTRTSAP